MKSKNKFNGIRNLRAKLSFDEGFAERPIYLIKGFTNEKEIGLKMLELVKQNFNIISIDEKEYIRKKLEDWQKDSEKPTILSKKVQKQQIKWTRDERGNISSPFSSKIKFK